MTNAQSAHSLNTLKDKMLDFHQSCAEKFGEHQVGYDITAQALIALDSNKDVLETFPLIFIGNHCSETNTFMWAWANDNMVDSARVQSRKLIDLSSTLESNEFVAPLLTFEDDDTGYFPSTFSLPEILAKSIEHLNALTLERFDFGSTDCYVAVMNPVKVEDVEA